jgi:hypothetical protein
MTLNIYYHAVPVGEASVTPDGIEVGDARWFAADTLPRRLAFPRHVAAVLDAWRRAVLAGETRTPLPDRPK